MSLPLRRFPRFSFRARAPLLASALLGLLLSATGCSLTPKTPDAPLRVSPLGTAATSPRAPQNLRVFDTVWNQVNLSYYDPDFNGADWSALAEEFSPQAAAAADDDALYGAINRMLARLKDPHTGAIPAEQVREERNHQFTGIGIRYRRIDGDLVVTDVYPGSPARTAGVLPGWRLLTRDGQALDGTKPFKPKLGQQIAWAFEDLTGQHVEFTLPAQTVISAYRESRLLRPDIGYIRFDAFTFEGIDWFKKRMAELHPLRGLVLDLRNNAGGDAIALLYALGHFIDRSQIVFVSLDRAETRARLVPLGKDATRYQGKLVVLVSPASASCSELLAAVVQEQGRGTVIGRQTAGAVLTALRLPLSDGGRLQYSWSDMLTARGTRLEGQGVTPDIVLPEPTREELRTGRDSALERALEELTKS